MIDLAKERELFEQSIPETDFYAKAVIRENNYYIKDPKQQLRKRDHENAVVRVNSGWNAWQKCAEIAQAQQQAIESLKAQLAQYQRDDYVSVKKSVVEQLIFELDYAFSEHKLLGLTDLIALRDGFSLLVDDEAQEQHNAKP